MLEPHSAESWPEPFVDDVYYTGEAWPLDAAPVWVVDSAEYAEPESRPPDVIAIGALILIFLILWSVISGAATGSSTTAAAVPLPTVAAPATSAAVQSQPVAPPAVAPPSFIAPYDDYALTQGPHGQSYGHYAIDIAAGNGAIIKAPITGEVTYNAKDGVGNTVLAIESDKYRVVLLHGVYTVPVGTRVTIGEPVGTESNIGNTTDMFGRSCAGRDCGYHTHLNVYDKELGRNVNPLDVIGR